MATKKKKDAKGGRRAGIAKAVAARATAVAAVADADRLRALLASGGTKLAAASAELQELAAVSAKRLARHPKRIRRRLEEATAVLEKRMRRARKRLRREAEDPAFGVDGADSAATASSGPPADGAPAVDAPTLAQAQADVLPAADLTGLTLYELRRRAKQEGRVGYSRLSKAELITLLT